MIPYTYLLIFNGEQETKFYYGVEYKDTAHPDNFWNPTAKHPYYTSSNIVKELRQLYGDESFSFEIRKTFDCPEKAKLWETKVLRRMNVVQHKQWINLSCFPAINFTSEIRLKMRNAKLGVKRQGHSIETIEKMKMSSKGRIISEEAKIKMRIAKLGKPSPRKGQKNSTEHRLKIGLKKMVAITDGKQTFESILEASNFYNVDTKTIHRRLNNEQNSSWKRL